MKTLEELREEYKNAEESIVRITEEINTKRRSITELKSKMTVIAYEIDSVKYANLLNSITARTGMNAETFLTALENGSVLVDTDTISADDPTGKNVHGGAFKTNDTNENK